MHQRSVYLNGRFVPEAEARLSIYDSALLVGDMAYEVTRTVRHRPFRLREHLRRLEHSLAVLGIDPGLGLDALERLTEETLARNLPTDDADVDWNILHNVSRGPGSTFLEAFEPEERRPTVVISCFPLARRMAALAPAYSQGVDLVVPRQRSLPSALLDASIKTRSRVHFQLAQQQAQAARPGATAVLVDPDGYLTEGTSGNVFFVRGGRVETPEPRNILRGVTREVVLELARGAGLDVRETNLTPADAAAADEAFVTSTTIGILPARSFEGRPLGTGGKGPVTTRLQDLWTAHVGLDFAAQAEAYARKLGP